MTFAIFGSLRVEHSFGEAPKPFIAPVHSRYRLHNAFPTER
jgi:hypothetical protein